MSANYFKFDKNKCVACQACTIACMNENGVQAYQQWRNIFTYNESKTPKLPVFHISIACNHCEDAPCMTNCPALAYNTSNITGGILHSADLCIGCQYCVWNCPYEAPKFNPFEGVIEKCNFCENRQSEKMTPACADLCPTGALGFSSEEINKSYIKPSIPVKRNPNPSLVINELRKESPPEMDEALFDAPLNKKSQNIHHNLGAKKEWPLLIFTFIISILVALSATGASQYSDEWLKWGMLSAGSIGALLSSLHLGKKFRMWRALLNIKNSWLSREILFFSIYFLLMGTDLFLFKLNYFIILIPGALLLFAIDMLYQPVQQKWKVPFHSGQAIFISISLVLLFSHYYWILLFVILARLFLNLIYFPLEKMDKKTKTLAFIRWSMIDISIILLLFSVPYWIIISVFLIGEFLDRILFYEALEVERVEISN